MTDILVYTEEQGNVIAGSVQPDRMTVAVLGAVGGGSGGSGAVSSVNGQIGRVVLDAADVGADPVGTGASAASAAVAAHVAAADPHPQYTTSAEAAAAAPVQSVNTQTGAVVLNAAAVGADAAGTAAAAVSAHEADTTPHAVVTQVDKFGFDTSAAQTAGVGEMVWNAADGTADLGLPGGVTLQVGQEQLIRVLNKTGSTIQNMHVVYITGAQGNRTTAAQAQANNTSADKTLAVATQDIANNAEGFATLQGLVRDVNTSAWAEGTELWLSAATAGAITNVRPAAPNHQVRVGYVVRSHASTGSIYVTVNVGADLDHLHDVVITEPADGDVLIYDTATQTWQNGPQTGGSGEVNTASNLGTGAGVFASKVAADLQFKSLVAGTNVSITSDATSVTISATGGGGGGGAVDSVNGQTGVVVLDTDDVAEGVTNLYFTNARASAAAPVQSVNGQTGVVNLSGSYAPLSHVGAGGTAHANVVAGGAAGFMTGADKTKLDGIASGATANANTDSLAEGSTNKYFTEGRVRSTVLTGLSLLTGGVISAADSVLSALGKLQKQISDAVTAIGGKQDTLVSGTNIKTVNGNSLLGAGDLSVSGGATLAQVVAFAGTSKTLALTDINTIVDCTSSSAVTITIPPQSSVAWTADAEIHVRMSGTGTVSIAVGSGVTIPPLTAPVALGGRGAVVTLKRRSADVWAVVGFIAGTFVAEGDARLTDAREWTAETVSQVEAEAGTATTRRAWTAQRVRQAIVAWWNSASSAWGRGFVSSADAAAGRTVLSVREQLTANRTYYVRTDGSDSNNGLANTAGGAFLTIQKAVDIVAGIDLGVFNATIKIADGTYPNAVVLKPLIGAGECSIEGNITTPENVLINPVAPAGNNVFSTGGGLKGSTYRVRGFKIECATAVIFRIGFGTLYWADIDFGAASIAMISDAGSRCEAVGNWSISASQSIHLRCTNGGNLFAANRTISISGNPAFGDAAVNAFISVSRNSSAVALNCTFVGSATGRKYYADSNGVVDSGGAGINYFPGNIAGVIYTGGQYL